MPRGWPEEFNLIAGSGSIYPDTAMHKGPVAEQISMAPAPPRAAHVVALIIASKWLHLVEIKLTGQHHNIGELRIKLHRLNVG